MYPSFRCRIYISTLFWIALGCGHYTSRARTALMRCNVLIRLSSADNYCRSFTKGDNLLALTWITYSFSLYYNFFLLINGLNHDLRIN